MALSNNLSVIYEDTHLLAVNKPADIVVERDQNTGFGLEVQALEYLKSKTAYPQKCFIGVVHRLDRPVTGVVLLAKKKSALKDLSNQFRERKVAKIYYAVVSPFPNTVSADLTHWLRKNTVDKKAEVFNKPVTNGVEARLRYEVTATNQQRALLKIVLYTGRYHQIRAQLSAIGCPVVGDSLYGSKFPYLENSIALHAQSLSFWHPLTRQKMVLQAPLPENDTWCF